MKKQIFWFLFLFPAMLFAQQSYWKVDRIKPVMQTGLVFESSLATLSNSDYIMYDEGKKQVWYYSKSVKDMVPRLIDNSLIKVNGKSPKDSRIEAKIVGGNLKVLIYQDNENIAFILCKKAADNKSAFLEKVKASKKP